MPEHIRQEPKVLVSTENLTEQEWLAYRRRGIGGSDVAAILGISPFRTARDLYDDKLNIASVADDAGNWVALEMGHLLEPLVARIFAKKTGLEVFQIKKMFQHPQYGIYYQRGQRKLLLWQFLHSRRHDGVARVWFSVRHRWLGHKYLALYTSQRSCRCTL